MQLFAQPWLNWALTVVWVVGITNALNFLDNMDGLSGGVATVAWRASVGTVIRHSSGVQVRV